MRFFRKIAGILGLSKDDAHDVKHEDEDVDSDNQARRGFSVPAQVAVNRPQPGPVLLPSTSRDGGVQVHSIISFFFLSLF